jgi:ribosomal protein L16/L10AE
METQVTTEETKRRDAPQAVSLGAVLASAWPALLLATACLLPFLNKAFVVDDPWFLTMAQQIVKHPAHPMDYEICWNAGLNDACRTENQFASGSALMGQIAQGYALVPTILSGAHEWTAHLTELVLVWISVVAMASLILRFGWDRWHAMAGALLLVAIPPFLPMASTAMPDILAAALALVAMERVAAWKAEQKWSQGAAAAVALGLAGFARTHLVLLLPLAGFFLLDSTNPKEILEQIRRRLWLWTPVFAGGVLMAAIVLAVRERNLALSSSPGLVGHEYVVGNLVCYLLYFVFPIPLAASWLENRLRLGRKRIVYVLAGLAVVPLLLHWRVSFVLCLAVIGAGVLGDLLFQTIKRREHTDCFLMLWILIPLPIVYYAHLPMKYMLPVMPAVILLCFRLLDGLSIRFVRAAVYGVIVAELTPFMRQWTAAKRENPDALLFFRMGDFYELFYDDAVVVSRELQLTLTARDRERNQPMCGVPYHAVESYLTRLLRKGYRIAICDQMEDPKLTKKIVRREVTRVLSPGRRWIMRWGRSRTIFWRRCLRRAFGKARPRGKGAKSSLGPEVPAQKQPDSPNPAGAICAVALLDVSTGEFRTAEFQGANARQLAVDAILMAGASEVLLASARSCRRQLERIPARTRVEDWVWTRDFAVPLVERQLNVRSLEGFGLVGHEAAAIAAGAVLHYVRTTQKNEALHIDSLRFEEHSTALELDQVTVRNLELVEPLFVGQDSGRRCSTRWMRARRRWASGCCGRRSCGRWWMRGA